MRFIQVGVGGFGNCWVNVLKESSQAEVVGMVDLSAKALRAACEKAGYDKNICFKSLKDALKEVDADTVVCVTPPEYHRECCVEAMKAGLDVITEKPMADKLENCKSMLKAAKTTGQTCVVSQNYRFQPPTWTMADIVRKGLIGEIGQVRMDFFMGVDFHGGFRHTMKLPLLIDMSIHHFDLIRFITGLNPVSVRATAWNPAWSNYKGDCSCSVVFEMDNGAHVCYNGSWCSKGQYCDWNGNWQIEGSQGTIRYSRGEIDLVSVPELYKIEKIRKMKLKSPRKLGQGYVLNDYIQSRRKKVRPQTDVYDNIQSVAMVFAAVKAVETGRKVPVLDKSINQILKAID